MPSNVSNKTVLDEALPSSGILKNLLQEPIKPWRNVTTIMSAEESQNTDYAVQSLNSKDNTLEENSSLSSEENTPKKLELLDDKDDKGKDVKFKYLLLKTSQQNFIKKILYNFEMLMYYHNETMFILVKSDLKFYSAPPRYINAFLLIKTALWR